MDEDDDKEAAADEIEIMDEDDDKEAAADEIEMMDEDDDIIGTDELAESG